MSSFLGSHLLPKSLHAIVSLMPPAAGDLGSGLASAYFLSLLPKAAFIAALALFFNSFLMLPPLGVARGVFGVNGLAGEVGVAGVLT